MLGTLCALITALTCVSGVTVVTQPAVVDVMKGQTATLNCNLGTVTDSAARWYKQNPGGVPQYVLSNVEEGDSAVYYCHTWDDSAKQEVFGQGTKLIVTDSSLAPPVLTVLPPSTDELQTNKATLVCLSSQSIPFADVTWLAGENPVSSGILTSTAVQRPDQSYLISSYLAVQTSDWNMDTVYTCKVSLGQQTSKKNINKSKCSSN
ncbi:immunoglobulin lambda-1 light chain-like isoform X7 [Embiotoca jacksoni]|uniref:immunoglobulin lambda-1 light chain-like isoform X7 n=1 Tax=Embiotoca jacksoni TaxID=100190 RepID=UPI003704042F